ncbi:MAG: ubiquinol-cytochrome C chaperone family protein [Phenylobacterium sp.]
MSLASLFRPRPAKQAAAKLYAAAVSAARRPALYTALGAPDTPEGRFELYTLHILLLIERLRGHGPAAGETSQALFDTYIRGLDDGLRELGVADTSIGKKMRRLGEAFYGRGKSYEAAIAALPDAGPLSAFLRRTVYAGRQDAPVDRLAEDLLAQRAALAAFPGERLVAGETPWEPRS